jgi:acetyl esterase
MQAPGLTTLRARIGRAATDGAWHVAAHATKRLPFARPARYGIERIENVAYRDTGLPEHTLDVYRPVTGSARMPVVLYLHGGGFRILSKDSHWMMGLAFARHGCVVLTISYRLAPAHPFPAAHEDACAALVWAVRRAADFGGDPERIVVAGESAGANLVTSLAIAASWPRPEPWARAVWDTGVKLRAALPACGVLQVSDTARFGRRKRLSSYVHDRLHEVEEAYLGTTAVAPGDGRELADPLLLLEKDARGERPLPPFFASVGTADPVLDDTRRLKAALDRAEVPCEVRYYPKEMHAFHALVVTPNARAYWREANAFVRRHTNG